MKARFLTKLAERKEKGSVRSLSLFDGYTDFYSNDYLGIARSANIPEIHAGSTGSRLISGNSKNATQAEAFMAEFFQSEASLIFNSGYDANLGVFSSVPQKGDTVLYDELIHASVRDGIRLSYAKAFSFRHNDTADLRKKIERAEGTVFVAVESLYSMDGDFAPLQEIAALCTEKKALLIIDEAHSGGIFGSEGRGLIEELQLEEYCFARLITFGKAYGTHGAAVLGSRDLCDYLLNFARSFIYTTALPPAHYFHMIENVNWARDRKLSDRLQQNIALFRSLTGEERLLSEARSPIQILPVATLKECLNFARKLQDAGIAAKPIMPPTVPENGQRLRICIHAHNTEEEIHKLVNVLIL